MKFKVTGDVESVNKKLLYAGIKALWYQDNAYIEVDSLDRLIEVTRELGKGDRCNVGFYIKQIGRPVGGEWCVGEINL